MTAAFRVFVPLGQSKVNDIYNMLVLSRSDQEIVRFDVTVEKSVLMHKLNPLELKMVRKVFLPSRWLASEPFLD